jgi:hypothetical protein
MQTIQFTNNHTNYLIHLSLRKTRNGFAHDSYLMKQSSDNIKLFYQIGKKTSAFYINRTWESYTYQTVIYKLIGANFDQSNARFIMLFIDNMGLS